MAKRSAGQFERRKNDTYNTPAKAVLPLLPHLPRSCYFVEPCAGRGDLVRHLEAFGHKCIYACDIEPRGPGIERRSAFSLKLKGNVICISNPPWTREILHPMIKHLASQVPTWFLFDSDWLFTKQAIPLMPIVKKVVAVGRVRWIEGSAMDGKENAAWFFLDARHRGPTEFYGRQP